MAKMVVAFVNGGRRLWTADNVAVPRVGEVVKVPGHDQEQYEVTDVAYKYEDDVTRVVVQCKYAHGVDRFQ